MIHNFTWFFAGLVILNEGFLRLYAVSRAFLTPLYAELGRPMPRVCYSPGRSVRHVHCCAWRGWPPCRRWHCAGSGRPRAAAARSHSADGSSSPRRSAGCIHSHPVNKKYSKNMNIPVLKIFLQAPDRPSLAPLWLDQYHSEKSISKFSCWKFS